MSKVATLQSTGRRGTVTTTLVIGLLAIGIVVAALAYFEASNLPAKTTTVTFGSLPGSADVSVLSVSCSHIAGACSLTLGNTGVGSATVTGCLIYGAQANVSGQTTVVAGSLNNPLTCTATSGAFTAGETVTGDVALSSGVPLPFSGTWS
jgi:hypothetical protein